MHSVHVTRQLPSLKALITGASGFVGSYLMDYLFSQSWQVYGFDRHVADHGKSLYVGDLTDEGILLNALEECQPNVVFHLAGVIKSPRPDTLYTTHLLGTVSLFESILKLRQHPLVIIASSSAVYGPGHGSRPISEKFQPRPITHYAVSKLAQEITALRYFHAFQLPVIIVRMFNLIGPGQSSDLACSAFARQIALAEVKEQDEIITGDLGARRDFVDVRDAARAFALVAEKGKAGHVYNVCSGYAVPMRKCLDDLLSMSPRQQKVRIDAQRTQKHDVPVQIGSARKLNQLTGWHPQIPLKQSLADLLADWRQRVKSGLE